MKEALDNLIRVGEMMSNVCFNFGQESGPNLDERARKGMKSLQNQWDEAYMDYMKIVRANAPKIKGMPK